MGFLVTGGRDQSNDLDSGNFFGHFRVTSRLSEIHCRKKIFTKSLGGPWPPWPPLATPLGGVHPYGVKETLVANCGNITFGILVMFHLMIQSTSVGIV